MAAATKSADCAQARVLDRRLRKLRQFCRIPMRTGSTRQRAFRDPRRIGGRTPEACLGSRISTERYTVGTTDHEPASATVTPC
jgi:hypothetical protein